VLREDGVSILHEAARDGNAEIWFLLDSVQAAQHTDTINELSRAQVYDRQTVWHVAVLGDNVQVTEKLVQCAKETLTTAEVNNKLLLAKDHREQTIWHVAVDEGNTILLQKM
jgi:hypothetical protein